MRFKLKCGMAPMIMMNFPSDVNYAKQHWNCSGCADVKIGGEVVCPGYEVLRHNINLDNDRDLVQYIAREVKNIIETEKV